MYTIYFDPKDYPGKYVMRKWVVDTASGQIPMQAYVGDSYDSVIDNLPLGLVKILRDPHDDPCILETWI